MSDAQQHPSIDCSEDGPYIVKGLKRLENAQGEQLRVRDTMALCRCGGSARKPFCDGTHRKNGFSGVRTNPDPPIHDADSYEGTHGTIRDNRSICAHVGKCTDGLPDVFRYGQEPWIDPNGAAAETIAKTVRTCPSGALAHSASGFVPAPASGQAGITVSKNGPYWVAGLPNLTDPVTGQSPYDAERYALCRCGASRNKPFCDGTHWSIEFTDDQD